ncbi:hypothetical protein M2444_005569 [Paenibacillus sp. PastF-3]|nr:hypothetical protein [Paenibacillus sp. PastF-3]SDJ41000.1 hypothetical protein SAMN05421868_12647 [Paenibacillus naphthalenovorans]
MTVATQVKTCLASLKSTQGRTAIQGLLVHP